MRTRSRAAAPVQGLPRAGPGRAPQPHSSRALAQPCLLAPPRRAAELYVFFDSATPTGLTTITNYWLSEVRGAVPHMGTGRAVVARQPLSAPPDGTPAPIISPPDPPPFPPPQPDELAIPTMTSIGINITAAELAEARATQKQSKGPIFFKLPKEACSCP